MNYKKIYTLYMTSFQNSEPRTRLQRRNPFDERLKYDKIYSEKHHITPRKLGGTNEKENLVDLLPEEHLWAHEIRFKAFGSSVDMLALRFMINGFQSNKKKIENFYKSETLTKQLRISYAFLKQNSYLMRKVGGWQSEEGVKCISNSRKGTMPVKDSITGKMIGSVKTNHPNVLSGMWVHHTTGTLTVIRNVDNEKVRITTAEYQINKNLYSHYNDYTGEKNPRWLNISFETKVEEFTKFCIDLGAIVYFDYFVKISRKSDKYKTVCGLGDMKMTNFYKDIQEKTNLPIMVKKSYSKEEKIKYFNGKSPKDFLQEYFNIDFSEKTFNYPDTHSGKGKKKK